MTLGTATCAVNLTPSRVDACLKSSATGSGPPRNVGAHRVGKSFDATLLPRCGCTQFGPRREDALNISNHRLQLRIMAQQNIFHRRMVDPVESHLRVHLGPEVGGEEPVALQ